MTSEVEVETTETDDTASTEVAEVEEQAASEVSEDVDSGLKKALAAERKAHREAEKRAKALEAQLADRDKPAEEQALEAARREARAEALQAANERIVRSELKAAAAGKVTNPALALKLIDTSEIDVGDDGEVDADAVSDAIDALLSEYPELAVKAGKFQGTADQGAKGREVEKKPQLTREQIKSLSPEKLLEAEQNGQLEDLFRGGR